MSVFSIAVVATMSAGKSTLVNSLLGTELMHSANEATTAKITVLEQDNQLDKYIGSAKLDSGIRLKPHKGVNAEILREWNRDSQVVEVLLKGPFENVAPLAKLIRIYDTPGPNNSQDVKHADALLNFITKTPIDLLIYVLNVTQIGINDDKKLLETITEQLRKNVQNIIFVVNKIDMLDPEKGESHSQIITQTKSYLNTIEGLPGGGKNIIIPFSAGIVLSLSKYARNGQLTRKEKNFLIQAINAYFAKTGEDSWLSYAEFNDYSIEKKRMIFNELIKKSGLLELNIELKNRVELSLFNSFEMRA